MRLAAATIALVAVATPASATWSIVAVDPATGEVGSAGASCTPYVVGIAELVPGRGAVVAQAASNMEAKARAVELLAAGAAAPAIVAAIGNASFDRDWQDQQYGVAALDAANGKATAAAFTGERTYAKRGHLIASGVAVQGNVLADERVLTATKEAFQAERRARRPLADALLSALEAGSRAGGDRRCGSKTAQSAYLGVALPSDPMGKPSLRIVVATRRSDAANPVSLVRERFEQTARSR